MLVAAPGMLTKNDEPRSDTLAVSLPLMQKTAISRADVKIGRPFEQDFAAAVERNLDHSRFQLQPAGQQVRAGFRRPAGSGIPNRRAIVDQHGDRAGRLHGQFGRFRVFMTALWQQK